MTVKDVYAEWGTATVEPEPLPENWECLVIEPTPGELALMNENAASLLADLVEG